jgi:hypothetical protein
MRPSAAVALDFVCTDNFFTYSPTTPGVWQLPAIGVGAGCGGQTAFGPAGTGSFSFTYPQPSTSFEWFGFQSTNGGKATVCFDGATPPFCDTANFFNASIAAEGATTSLYRKTGLSNAIHTVIVTNIADPSNGNQFGPLTLDKVSLSGSVTVPPSFPPDSFLAEVSLVNEDILVGPVIGSGSPGFQCKPYKIKLIIQVSDVAQPTPVFMDSGAGGSWVVWSGCTDPNCSGHPSYTPSPNAVNFSKSDQEFYTEDSLEFDSWRMNDTMTFGNVSFTITFGAAYKLAGPSVDDGNIGVAKAYFIGAACANTYPSFIEYAYLSGAIKSPVLAYYMVSDDFFLISCLMNDGNSLIGITRRTSRCRSDRGHRPKQIYGTHRLAPHDPRRLLGFPQAGPFRQSIIYRQAVQCHGIFHRGSACIRHWIPQRRALDPARGLPHARRVDRCFRQHRERQLGVPLHEYNVLQLPRQSRGHLRDSTRRCQFSRNS